MQIGVQQAFHGPEDLVGTADRQMGEPVVLEQLEGDGHRVAEVAQGRLVDMMVIAIRTPAGIVVTVEVVARQCVEQFRAIDQLTHLVDEHPGPLAVGEQDPRGSSSWTTASSCATAAPGPM